MIRFIRGTLWAAFAMIFAVCIAIMFPFAVLTYAFQVAYNQIGKDCEAVKKLV